LLSPMV